MTERHVALRTALGVLLVLFILGCVGMIISLIQAATLQPFHEFGLYLGSAIVQFAARAVLVGAGVLVSLAIVRPVAEGSALRTVAVRGTIAAAIGAAVYAVIDTLYTLLHSLSVSGGFFGNSFPRISSPYSPGVETVQELFSALGSFLGDLPIVLLVLLVVVRHWPELESRSRS